MIASMVSLGATAAAALPLVDAWGPSGAAVAAAVGYLAGIAVALFFFARLAGKPEPVAVAKPLAAAA